MALKEPLVGRHHVTEMFKSLMRCSNDLHIVIVDHIESTCNGSRVITFNHKARGRFYFYHTVMIIPYLFSDHMFVNILRNFYPAGSLR